MEGVRFLSFVDVVAIHALCIGQHGGSDGLRDEHLLRSALSQPEASFEGDYLHSSLWEMAAAYLFHLSQNQAFVDGNKRTAVLTAVTFLWLNDQLIGGRDDELYDLVIGFAERRRTKTEAASWFEEHRSPSMVPPATMIKMLSGQDPFSELDPFKEQDPSEE